jgi:predicted RNase H-like HicB family nuclease
MTQAVAHEWVVLDKPGVEPHHVLLTFRAYQAADGDAAYESQCDELDVASCGDTVAEALANAVEATLLYLNTLEELGQRRRVFDELGIDFDRGMPPTRRGGKRGRAAKKVAVGPGETVQRHTLALT